MCIRDSYIACQPYCLTRIRCPPSFLGLRLLSTGIMGVPKFFRWMSERYPAISQLIAENRIPEFDCLYVSSPIAHCSPQALTAARTA